MAQITRPSKDRRQQGDGREVRKEGGKEEEEEEGQARQTDKQREKERDREVQSFSLQQQTLFF